jgi:hypothetical protein
MTCLPHRAGVVLLGTLATAICLSAANPAAAQSYPRAGTRTYATGPAVAPASATVPATAETVDEAGKVKRTQYIQEEVVGSGTRVYGSPGRGLVPRGYTPTPRSISGRVNGETIITGEPSSQTILHAEGEIFSHPGPDCHSCNGSGCGTCRPACGFPCPCIDWENLTVFVGVQGFTGPVNYPFPDSPGSGSFGFNEGINWGFPVPCTPKGELGFQAGFRSVQANLSGGGDFLTTSTRDQLFVTLGGFRRVDWGLQGGLVIDYMFDDWWAEVNLAQLRGELSWVFPCQHEFGFWFAAGTSEEQRSVTIDTTPDAFTFEPVDLYAFFYRRRFLEECGGEGRLFAGFTGRSDGYIGGDIFLPLNSSWALRADFAYLIPDQSNDDNGNAEESWNIGINLVWHPKCNARCGGYNRPLFNVADNGTFMVDRTVEE